MATKRSSTDDRLDAVFHALSDRTRRTLLNRLSRESAKITELAEPFAISLPAVSKHLRVLEHARLIRRTIDGRIHRCSLTAAPLEDVEQWIAHYRSFWEGTLEALDRYVRRPAKRKRKSAKNP